LGKVSDFKLETLKAATKRLVSHLSNLRVSAGLAGGDAGSAGGDAGSGARRGVFRIHVEDGSTPADLQRQFQMNVNHAYLGHRFLYFEPQGAVAWKALMEDPEYDQSRWLAGVAGAAHAWLAPRQPVDAVAHHGVELISLGSGEGSKDARLLAELIGAAAKPPWIAYVPVDVSVPLLVAAARDAAQTVARASAAREVGGAVMPFCADFEEGALEFLGHLPTGSRAGVRLILVLGNVFGNVRDEERFVDRVLTKIARPKDLVWIEVALRPDDLAKDPVHSMTLQTRRPESATALNRWKFIVGPYVRCMATMGAPLRDVKLRIKVHVEDDVARIPESCNFVHDLLIGNANEEDVCTMLYSRRYREEPLKAWFRGHGFQVDATSIVDRSNGVPGVMNLLLRKL